MLTSRVITGGRYGRTLFSKVWLFPKQKLNYVQLVSPEHQNDFIIVLKWFLIMSVCIFILQRDYKGETGCDGVFHFLDWKQVFRCFWSHRQFSCGQYASRDTHKPLVKILYTSSIIAVIWHKYAITSYLCHMTMMTEDIFDMMNMGLRVSMGAYWPQETGL